MQIPFWGLNNVAAQNQQVQKTCHLILMLYSVRIRTFVHAYLIIITTFIICQIMWIPRQLALNLNSKSRSNMISNRHIKSSNIFILPMMLLCNNKIYVNNDNDSIRLQIQFLFKGHYLISIIKAKANVGLKD